MTEFFELQVIPAKLQTELLGCHERKTASGVWIDDLNLRRVLRSSELMAERSERKERRKRKLLRVDRTANC